MTKVNLSASPRTISTALIFITFMLLLANILGLISTFYFDRPYAFGLVPLFDLNQENNIPTFYSAIAILFCSILLGLITYIQKQKKKLTSLGLASA